MRLDVAQAEPTSTEPGRGWTRGLTGLGRVAGGAAARRSRSLPFATTHIPRHIFVPFLFFLMKTWGFHRINNVHHYYREKCLESLYQKYLFNDFGSHNFYF